MNKNLFLDLFLQYVCTNFMQNTAKRRFIFKDEGVEKNRSTKALDLCE